MIIETRACAPFFKNGFVLGCEETREAVVIDPGDEVDELIDVVRQGRLTVRSILLTHAHVDHITGVGAAKAAFGVPVALHRDDLFLYDRVVDVGRMFGLQVQRQPPVDVFYEPGQRFAFGRYVARPHHTPGHCPGGVCLQVGLADDPTGGDDLFVGDTLFAGSIGRTDLPGGDYDTLIASIVNVLFAFGDAARVYPGHGPATTIGDERRTNPFLRD
jgi:glyoxylase-like metal-dependent hydrolase (beta-lactamase superfamily II)